jgi:competence/damage-inducible protein CinA-like protein
MIVFGGLLPSAEIIAIGTELLLGEIQDTNTHQIALFLRNEGIDLFRTTIVGDNENRITNAVQEAVKRANIIITTGGLGPTVDDPTRNAIANALSVELEYRPELWEQIIQRFNKYGRTPTENNKKQAFIPHGGFAIENKVGTAPAFYCFTENGMIISLPGVPKELEYLLENNVKDILNKFFSDKSIIQTLTIHTSGAGESLIDEKISDLELLTNPTVGMVAYPGQVDIRITAKAREKTMAEKMISEISLIICQRLDGLIFGFNNELLEKVVADQLNNKKIKIFIIEYGLDHQISNLLQESNVIITRSDQINNSDKDLLELSLENLYKQINPNILLIVNLIRDVEKNITLTINYYYQNQFVTKSLLFGGHENLAIDWATKTTLNFLRIQLINI